MQQATLESVMDLQIEPHLSNQIFMLILFGLASWFILGLLFVLHIALHSSPGFHVLILLLFLHAGILPGRWLLP